jgi:hypothetical protein
MAGRLVMQLLDTLAQIRRGDFNALFFQERDGAAFLLKYGLAFDTSVTL